MTRVNLTEKLSVDISISDQLSFQPLPELGIEEAVVCFWENEQVSFILSLDEQPAFKSHDEHWALLEDSLEKEFGSLQKKASGIYETEASDKISYTIYDADNNDSGSLLIYHLISNGKISYWIIGTLLFCSDSSSASDIIISLLETATLKA